MISQKFKNEVISFTDQIYQEDVLIDVLESLSRIHGSTTANLSTLFKVSAQGDANATHRTAEKFKNSIIAETNDAIRKAKFSAITRSAEQINKLAATHTATIAYEIPSKIDVFVDCLDQHLHAPSIDTCLALTSSAHELVGSIYEIQSLRITLEHALKTSANNNPSLALYLPGHTDLESFAQKTESLFLIFELSCQLLGMSTTEAEVGIKKIESGSFFAEIFANPLVIALTTVIVTKGTDYIFDNLDPSRKHNELRESSENIEKILGLRNFLAENNFDTSAMDEQIKKASVAIAKQLGNLIDDQQEIEINNKVIKTTNRLSIPGNKNPAIENKTTKTDQ